MKARRDTRGVQTGLKSMSAHRKFEAKGYIPRDTDGAHRVDSRLDGEVPADVYIAALKRKAGS